MQKLDAILACRVQGTRLYGKPLQPLIANKINILECLISYLREIKLIRKIVLAISVGDENSGFVRIAKELNLPYIIGDEFDVLHRIIKATDQEGSEHVFRLTTESPFVLYEYADVLIEEYLKGDFDFAYYADSPEGTGYEIISTRALKISHNQGSSRHRSELVTSYVCEHQNEFRILRKQLPKALSRPEVRLTVDYAEDLIFCQKVYNSLKEEDKLIPVEKIIKFWDQNPELRKPLEKIGIDWGTGRLVWSESDKVRANQKKEKEGN